MTKSGLPGYLWFPGDAAGDRAYKLMTLAEQGLYRGMLDAQWTDGPLPDDPEAVAALLTGRVTPEDVRACWDAVMPRFTRGADGRLYNGKLEKVREDAVRKAEKLSQRGRAGALARWASARNGNTQAHAQADAQASDAQAPAQGPPVRAQADAHVGAQASGKQCLENGTQPNPKGAGTHASQRPVVPPESAREPDHVEAPAGAGSANPHGPAGPSAVPPAVRERMGPIDMRTGEPLTCTEPGCPAHIVSRVPVPDSETTCGHGTVLSKRERHTCLRGHVHEVWRRSRKPCMQCGLDDVKRSP